MTPLAVLGSGMVTGVGWSTEATCAAIRVGITGFVETRFTYDGDFIQGCPVIFPTPFRGRRKLIEMAALAIEQALVALDAERCLTESIPLLLCLSESSRPGRFAGLDESFLHDVSERIGRRFHAQSAIVAVGRIGGVNALLQARHIVERDARIQRVLVCGVDTYLVARTLNHYHEQRRLLTTENSDGFIPGEAACAVALGTTASAPSATIAVTGIGLGREPGLIDSEVPLRADGMVAAIKQAVGEAEVDYPHMAYRLTDNSGEQYGYKESVLAMTRVVRPTKPSFDIEHPADCIGEVGAAIVPGLLAVATMAERKSYAPGRFMGDVVLCHVGSDDGDRAAFVLRACHALRPRPEGAA